MGQLICDDTRAIRRGAQIKETISVGGIEVKPGSAGHGWFKCGELSDSAEISLPVVVVNGSDDGPVLLLVSTMHGPEITGIEIIRRLYREILDPSQVRGGVIGLPIANPYAYRACSWLTPQDGMNLNRAFPGTPDKWATGRLARLILDSVVAKADYILDYHTMCEPTMMYCNVKRTSKVDVADRSMAMARAFGLSVVELVVEANMEHRAGTMLEAAAFLGKPGLSVELEVWRRMPEHAVTVGTRGTLNVMKHLGILSGELQSQTDVPIVPQTLSWHEIFADRGGLVQFTKKPYQEVRNGEVIARIRDPFGDVLDNVQSPVGGYLIGYPVFWNQAVGTGEMLAFLGSPSH